MEKKIMIKGILKTGKEEVVVSYQEEGSSQTKTSQRKFYPKKRFNVVVFKGVQYLVKFDQQGMATEIKARGVDHGTQEIAKELPKKVEAPNQKIEVKNNKAIKHIKFDQIKACVESEVPVYLYGPAGSGKNHVLQQIAEELGIEFYFTNSVQQEFKITGFIDAGGNYHETEFYKAFKNGGLFFLDEMDASIPEVLVLLNAALANGYFEFPTGKIDAHEDFRVVAAGNTVGTGADEQYSGRLQLDQATLDRFAMIEFDYDRNIELAISKGNEELVQFIRSLRNQAKTKGINATFSYRCISMVTKLEGKLELKEVVRMAVVKGMDMDTLRTFNTSASNKYSKALWMLVNKAG
jgi:cobaltochelatase CobS